MNDLDRHLDESLQAFGRTLSAPESIPRDVRARCMAALEQSDVPHSRAMLRRPAVLSTVGLTIALATSLGLFFPTNGGPTVHAATVLEKLSRQVTGNDVIEARLDRVQVEEVTLHGQVLVADAAVAGDVFAIVDEGNGLIEVDAAFGITEESGWILVRKLRIPDKGAQVLVDMFLPRDQETLILLPPALVKAKLAEGLGGGLSHVREMAGGHLATVVKSLIESKSASGAQTKRLADGTILVTVDLKDKETIQAFMSAVASSMGKDGSEALDDHDVNEFLGAAFTVVYDPATEAVRSFSVTGVKGITGVITVALHGGTIAPALLDSTRVAKPGTRTLDLEGLLQSVDGLQEMLKRD